MLRLISSLHTAQRGGVPRDRVNLDAEMAEWEDENLGPPTGAPVQRPARPSSPASSSAATATSTPGLADERQVYDLESTRIIPTQIQEAVHDVIETVQSKLMNLMQAIYTN